MNFTLALSIFSLVAAVANGVVTAMVSARTRQDQREAMWRAQWRRITETQPDCKA